MLTLTSEKELPTRPDIPLNIAKDGQSPYNSCVYGLDKKERE